MAFTTVFQTVYGVVCQKLMFGSHEDMLGTVGAVTLTRPVTTRACVAAMFRATLFQLFSGKE